MCITHISSSHMLLHYTPQDETKTFKAGTFQGGAYQQGPSEWTALFDFTGHVPMRPPWCYSDH